MTRFVSSFGVALALIACGGQARMSSGEVGTSSGGSGEWGGDTHAGGGEAGTSSGGGDIHAGGGEAGTSSGGSCQWGGETYADGELWRADCNTCTCNDGESACTEIACGGDTCLYDGTAHEVGDSFPALDGCNTCSCATGGAIDCTLLSCNKMACQDLATAAIEYEKQAKVCDPQASRECTERVEGYAGCLTYVNAENASAIALLAATRDQHSELQCSGDAFDCIVVEWALCTADGRCEDAFDHGRPACKVNGHTYYSGMSGIPGLFGCNTCTCDHGSLTCTGDESCEGACPPGSAPGTQCDTCGVPFCSVVEVTCLKLCETTCNVGTCIDGMCRNACE